MIAHPELLLLAIAHIDCDAFYAAIEKRDDPSLIDKPVIVGGGRRGVVSTACYIARISGVRSAMPMFKALRACPEAVVIRPNMEKYAAVGRQIREMMRALTPLVEPLSIDEAFLDLTGTARLHKASPAETLVRFAARVEREIGITVSIGLSHNKFLAKVASDLDKPRGFAVIGRAETVAFLSDKPVSLIWGVGKATMARLEAAGITRIGDILARDETELAARFGGLGLRLARLARGEDTRAVEPEHERKSVSAETTFEDDVDDADELVKRLWPLCEKVSSRLKAQGIAGRTVTLKLKSADFRQRTRAVTLAAPTRLADRIFAASRPLLTREADGTPFRLIGIGVSDLVSDAEADPRDLVDEAPARRADAELAVDRVRQRFGRDAVQRGLVFTPRPKAKG